MMPGPGRTRCCDFPRRDVPLSYGIQACIMLKKQARESRDRLLATEHELGISTQLFAGAFGCGRGVSKAGK